MRRRKSWRCGLVAVAMGLFSVLLACLRAGPRVESENAFVGWLFFGLAALTCISGIVALIFRFTETPSEVIVRRWPEEPPLIH